MKIVTHTMYQAHDGREFTTADACTAHERELGECNEITGGMRHPSRDFIRNGGGYIQHNPLILRGAVGLFCDRLIARFTADKQPDEWDAKDLAGLLNTLERVKATPTHDLMDRLRYYQDRCGMWNGPYAELLCRFNCMDFKKAREFDQPYYVTHQDEVSGGALNEGAVP